MRKRTSERQAVQCGTGHSARVIAPARDFAAELAEIDDRIERFGAVRLGFGRYANKPLAAIYDHQPTYLGWVLCRCHTRPEAQIMVRAFFEALIMRAVTEREAVKAVERKARR